MSEETQDRLIPVSKIVGLAELSVYLGESRNTVSNWMNRRNTYNFPRPVLTLAAGPLWDMRDVAEWSRSADGRRWLEAFVKRTMGNPR